MNRFIGLVVLSQALGVCAVITLAVWLGNFLGGYGWGYKNEHKFNYHPLFMVLGLVYLYGNAILVYRVFRNDRKIMIKILHAVMQTSAFGFAVFGLVSVFSAHNDEGFPNLYSLHSWLGLSTVCLFGTQLLIGFIFFLFPKTSESLRKAYMPHHRFWGMTIFVMATATALMGVVENTGFKVTDYSSRTQQTYIINTLGVLLVTFAILVVYLVSNDEYKRENPASEYEEPLTN